MAALGIAALRSEMRIDLIDGTPREPGSQDVALPFSFLGARPAAAEVNYGDASSRTPCQSPPSWTADVPSPCRPL